MKKTWKTFGTLIGIATAITVLQQPVAAEDNSSLELKVDALSEANEQVSVLDAQLSLPAVGNVEAQISTQDANDSSLAEVSANDSELGNVQASLLTSSEVERALIEVNVTDNPVGDLSAEVTSESEDVSNSDSSAVDVEVDSNQVGDISATVLPENTSSEGQQDETSVIEVEVGSVGDDVRSTIEKAAELQPSLLTGEVEVGVSDSDENALAGYAVNEVNADSTAITSEALVELQALPLSSTVKADVEVGQPNADENVESSSLVQLPVENDLLEGIQVGVSESSLLGNEDEPNDGGVLDVNADDLPLLSETYIGLLDEHLRTEGTENSLAQINLTDGILDDASVDVVGEATAESTFDRGVLDVNADDLPLLGEAHVGVLDEHSVDELFSSEGVINIDKPLNPFVDMQVNVLPDEQMSDDNDSAVIQSGVSIAFRNSALTPIDLGLLSKQSFTAVSPDSGTQLTTDNEGEDGMTDGSDGSGQDSTTEEELTGTIESPNIGSNSGSDTAPNIENSGADSPIIIEGEGDIFSPPTTEEAVPGGSDNSGQADPVGEDFGTEGLSGFNFESGSNENFLASNGGSFNTNFLMAGNDSSSYSPSSGVLPKTGGFLDGMMLAIIGLLLIAGGYGMRRYA